MKLPICAGDFECRDIDGEPNGVEQKFINCTIGCYIRRKLGHMGTFIYGGCITSMEAINILCSRNKSNDKVKCCFKDHCNFMESYLEIKHVTAPSNTSHRSTPDDLEIKHVSSSLNASPRTTTDNQSNKSISSFVIIPVVGVFVIGTTIIFSVCIFIKVRRKNRLIKAVNYDDRNYFTKSLSVSLDSSGSGSGFPLLAQRTVARIIKVGDLIGSGRFGQVYVGDYLGEKLAVKKFFSHDEDSWFRETKIYNTVLLRHDNILGFFASDIFSNNGVTELWLITQYHPNGSLYDYLNQKTVSPKIMMKMAISTCNGLAHLHTELLSTVVKPIIAHRDIQSKNILVKDNLECCIGDFGLSAIKETNKVELPTNPRQGAKRYMAPEILSESIDMREFVSFIRADIYAFGIVLWEICSRCQLGSCESSYSF